jgi:hypothetical protein
MGREPAVLGLENASALLMERYPEIGFSLQCLPYTPVRLAQSTEGQWNGRGAAGHWLHAEGDPFREAERWKKALRLESIDALYVYGIGLGYYYPPLREWLRGHRDRVLIFLEEDLGVIAALLEMEHAVELLSDPQVYLCYLPEGEQRADALEDLARQFPIEKIEVAALASYARYRKRRWEEISLRLLRDTGVFHAFLVESLHFHQLFANFLPNLLQLERSVHAEGLLGQFRDVPAVICGAGPSLNAAIPLLRALDQRALLLAGGSAITALSAQGVSPHLAIALDPNQEEYLRLKPSLHFEGPLLYALRLHPAVCTTCNGPFSYLRSGTGGICEAWIEERLQIHGTHIGLDLGREALSVTTLALSLAYALGCNPILFAGVDLAYTGLQRYASGVMTDSGICVQEMQNETRATERLLQRRGHRGASVHTLLKWVMESECIGAFARSHPDRLFLNTSPEGLGFPGVPYAPLEKCVRRHCRHAADLRGRLHVCMHEQMEGTRGARDLALELRRSLDACQLTCEEVLRELDSVQGMRETGRMTALICDLEEESAFSACLHSLGPALDLVSARARRSFDPSDEAAQYNSYRRTKWQHYLRVIIKLKKDIDDNI